MRNTPELQEITDRIASQVLNARLEKGLTRTELAAQIGVSHQQVQKYERGSNRISAARLEVIAKALNVPISIFYDDTANVPSEHQRLTVELVRSFRMLNPGYRIGIVNLIRTLKGA